MKIVLSPAKRLNLSREWSTPFHTQCKFLEKAMILNTTLRNMSLRELSLLMRTSPSVSRLSYARHQNWTSNATEENGKPAILSFDGGVYRFLKAGTFSRKDLEYAQDHVRIISGLYGVLRPLDLILPYRLEMGTLLRIDRHKNLHSYWKSTVTEEIQSWLSEGEPIVNLASQEYARTVDFDALRNPVITVSFKDKSKDKDKRPGGSGLRVVGFWTKEARGEMTRQVVTQQISELEEFKRLTPRGYQFSENLSSEAEWVFVR